MFADETPPILTAWSRVGVTFRLFMHLRVLLIAVSAVVLPTRMTGLVLLGVVGALSWVEARWWEPFLPVLARYPALLCLDALFVYTLLERGGVFGPVFLCTLITAALAGVLYEWRGLLLVCVLQIVLYYFAARSALTDSQAADLQMLIGLPICYPIAGCAGIGLNRLFGQYADAEEARRRAETLMAAAEERARLAREMHDSLAKTLQGIALTAGVLPQWVRKSPERAEQEALRIADAAKSAAGEARELIADLRDGEPTRPLAAVLDQALTEWSCSSGIPVQADLAPDADLPLLARYELVAILKEALTNVERHAEASKVAVEFTGDPSVVRLTVRDDGRGLVRSSESDEWLADLARQGHYGLVGMAERARRAGGSMTVESRPGAGTTLLVTVPVADPVPGLARADVA